MTHSAARGSSKGSQKRRYKDGGKAGWLQSATVKKGGHLHRQDHPAWWGPSGGGRGRLERLHQGLSDAFFFIREGYYSVVCDAPVLFKCRIRSEM